MLYSKELKWASNLNRKINLLDLIFFCFEDAVVSLELKKILQADCSPDGSHL